MGFVNLAALAAFPTPFANAAAVLRILTPLETFFSVLENLAAILITFGIPNPLPIHLNALPNHPSPFPILEAFF